MAKARCYDEEFEGDEFVTCKICLKVFDETKRTPKFLPCSHTLCLPCINSIAFHVCPFCRNAFQPLGLPTNFYALQMLKEKKRGMKFASSQLEKFLDISERSLNKVLMIHKRIDDQLAHIMSSVNLAERRTQRLIDQNNSSLTHIVYLMESFKSPDRFPASVLSTKKFFSKNLLSKFILKLFQSDRLVGEIHINPAPISDFVQELGEFCYRSPKIFSTFIDKAMAGIFVSFPMNNPQFVPGVPSATEQMGSGITSAAKNIDEVGITVVKSLIDDTITGWSFVFVLEDFQRHENLLAGTVMNNQFFGRVICHHAMASLIKMSLFGKSDSSNFLATIESQ